MSAPPPPYSAYGPPPPSFAVPPPGAVPAPGMLPPPHPSAAGGFGPMPMSKVELRFSCTDLPNLDLVSRSDPQIFVYLRTLQPGLPGQTARESLVEIGRTEVVKDSLNPKFAQPVVVDYFFEATQNLRVICVDNDSANPRAPLRDHDFLGYCDTTLGNIVSSGRVTNFERKLEMRVPPGMSDIKPPPPNARGGTLKIQVEELDINGAKKSVSLKLRGSGLDKKDLFGKSDPFLVISKARNDGQFAVVHKTEVIKNTLDPVWQQPIRLKMDVLCNGDVNRLLRFECFDWDKDGTHDLIGVFHAPLSAFQRGATFELINAKKQQSKGKSYKNSGVIIVDDIQTHRELSFIDYISTGTQINLAVAIDFTQSNGSPENPTSLHYRNPDPRQLNEYQRAIVSIGNVLEPYDSDKRFLCYGFGARLPSGDVSHFFPLNLAQGPEVSGVQGLLEAYNRSLHSCALYGPTNFSPTISAISQWARGTGVTADGTISCYTILLMITDGAITDLDTTIRAVVDASSAPLSIIIVGVGGADFSTMDLLDSDNKLLSSGGFVAERDCVQFVPFRRFSTSDFNALSAATLREVPGQFMAYVNKRGIKPMGEPR